MRPWEKTEINERGNMTFAGCDLVELAKEYGNAALRVGRASRKEGLPGVCRLL